MGQDPDAIRQEIEQTRSQMGDTVEAIGYKTDVKARAKDSVTEKTDAVKDKVSSVMGRASDSTPSGDDVKQGVGQAVSTAQENPLGLAIGAVAVGFVAGMLIPSTSVEDEKIGPMADQLKERAKETGQEALDHGKQVAQDVAQSAQETVKESGQQHAQELASSAPPSQG
jgi:gas vesicle protein